MQCEKLEHHPAHQHLPYQWRAGGSPPSSDSAPSSPKGPRSSVMVSLSSLGHSISSRIRPVGRKPEDKKEAKDKERDQKDRSKTESNMNLNGASPKITASTSSDIPTPMFQPICYVKALCVA